MTDYNVAEWLLYDVVDGKARNLKCKFCIMFEDKIKDLPNFSNIFVKGSQNYKKCVVESHVKNKTNDPRHPHTVAYNLYLKECQVALEQRSELLAKSGGHANESIVSSLKKIPPEDLEKLRQFIFQLKTNSL